MLELPAQTSGGQAGAWRLTLRGVRRPAVAAMVMLDPFRRRQYLVEWEREWIRQMTDYMPWRYKIILGLLHGQTYQAVALELALSRERVRQIYQAFFRRLERRSRYQSWWWIKR